MNLLNIHQYYHYHFHPKKSSPSRNLQTTLLSAPRFLSLPPPKPKLSLASFNSLSASVPSRSHPKFNFKFNHGIMVSETEFPFCTNEEEREAKSTLSTDLEDLAPEGQVYKKTLRLVECSMFAAVSGLAYFLSNSLAIENYFGCFFGLPMVISSMRWGIAAGRKTMVATALLLLVLSGPVKALTYLLMHGLLGFTMGAMWRLRASWGVSIFFCSFVVFASLLLCSNCFLLFVALLYVDLKLGLNFLHERYFDLQVRAMGAMGYVLISSFLIRENILALITINIHASLTFILTSLGVQIIPSMDMIYALFGTLLYLNCGTFVFLLHLLYAVFFVRLGMKTSLRLPRWLEMAI